MAQIIQLAAYRAAHHIAADMPATVAPQSGSGTWLSARPTADGDVANRGARAAAGAAQAAAELLAACQLWRENLQAIAVGARAIALDAEALQSGATAVEASALSVASACADLNAAGAAIAAR